MKMTRLAGAFGLVLTSVLCGCGTDYSWRSSVPAGARTICVPTFRNESDVMELGSIASRQILREIQREGTFRVTAEGDAALEVQGTVKSAKAQSNAYDRRTRLRMSAYDMKAVVVVSVIDKRTHKVLMDNREYVAQTGFTAGQDLTTAQRDASGRLMDDLSRQVVDDLLNLKW